MKYLLLGVICMLLAACPRAWCARNDTGERKETAVRLRDSMEVRRSRVWLSDLLPPDAPPAIQKASAAIELCPAPQPGSARVFDAAQIASRLVGRPEVLRQLAIPPRITIRYSGWPIAEAAVRIAISKFLREPGLLEPSLLEPGPKQTRDLPDAARLEWLPPLAATEESPTLQVIGMEWDNRQESLQVRLRCLARASCGSFLVHVVLPAPLGQEWRNRLGSGAALISPPAGQPAATTAPGAALAERGKAATLVLDDGNMRISVRVICLQAGVLNQQIRVFDAKSRHVFHAEVVGAGLLHAAL
jgi:Chaperone for flagella basal body P-ring formation